LLKLDNQTRQMRKVRGGPPARPRPSASPRPRYLRCPRAVL